MKPEPVTMQKALELNAHGAGTEGFHLGISADAFVLSCTVKLNGTSAEDLAVKMLSLAAVSDKVSLAMGAAIAEHAERMVADQVKAALLQDGGIASENKLDEEIGRIDLTTSISGETLKNVATRTRSRRIWRRKTRCATSRPNCRDRYFRYSERIISLI